MQSSHVAMVLAVVSECTLRHLSVFATFLCCMVWTCTESPANQQKTTQVAHQPWQFRWFRRSTAFCCGGFERSTLFGFGDFDSPVERFASAVLMPLFSPLLKPRYHRSVCFSAFHSHFPFHFPKPNSEPGSSILHAMIAHERCQ